MHKFDYSFLKDNTATFILILTLLTNMMRKITYGWDNCILEITRRAKNPNIRYVLTGKNRNV